MEAEIRDLYNDLRDVIPRNVNDFVAIAALTRLLDDHVAFAIQDAEEQETGN